jgi:hypothetical protein
MTFICITYPIALLSAACIGYGALAMTLFCSGFAKLPIAFRLTAAYFLGQGLLAGLFVVLALYGVFTFPVVLGVMVPGAIFCVATLFLYRHEMRSTCAAASRAWLLAPASWRLITFLAAGLYIYGLSAMGRLLEGDATAFYLAAAKLIAYTGRIGTLPGYDGFSWVIMTGELLYASLMLLGSPGTGARLYEWINFLPVLVSLYWVARICNLSARAAFLSAVMALTSSAAIGLWAGGKTDTFAAGPALIGIWFALASWKSDRRWNYVAMSGLFCGFAIVAKVSYLVTLLPGVMLLIHWRDIGAALEGIRTLNWKAVVEGAGRIVLTSLWLFGFLALALAPFVIKNLMIFHAPLGLGAGGLASGKWFSTRTVVRLILSYPIALTYGRYWGQLGTLSPLILAFVPLFFLMPRNERQLFSPLMAMTISTAVALAIWMALMPSIFMPRYILATLLLFGIPAAAGAVSVSRERTLLAGVVVLAVAIVIVLTPSQVNSRSPIFDPGRALDYFATGDERKLFLRDPYVKVSFEVNDVAPTNDRVLLLVYPRLWLRGDLLVATSTQREVGEAKELLEMRSERFWAYLQDKRFNFIIVDTPQFENVAAVTRVKPAGLAFCEVRRYGNVAAFQIGEACTACPSGSRTVLSGPFAKPWADGNAYIAKIPELEITSDSSGFPDRSTLAVCEGEERLRPSHSVHSEIRTEGDGRFSHWDKELYFSTSDNSDPNSNGRTYTVTVVQPR